MFLLGAGDVVEMAAGPLLTNHTVSASTVALLGEHFVDPYMFQSEQHEGSQQYITGELAVLGKLGFLERDPSEMSVPSFEQELKLLLNALWRLYKPVRTGGTALSPSGAGVVARARLELTQEGNGWALEEGWVDPDSWGDETQAPEDPGAAAAAGAAPSGAARGKGGEGHVAYVATRWRHRR